MLQNHPKGLFALALANTGERFGYYTMLAIFTLYLQVKFGMSPSFTSTFFGGFLALVYFLPLLGGIVADKMLGYGKTVVIGITIMFIGYLLLFMQLGEGSMAMVMMILALVCIALGTGLFKGNLQVMVGNLYDDPRYSAQRDSAFSLFYMAINIGALFAPTAATEITNAILAKSGYTYNAQIPALANQLIHGDITAEGTAQLQQLAAAQGATGGDLSVFAQNYINALSSAYSYAFGIACISLIISMIIYFACRNWFKHADYNSKQLASRKNTGAVAEVELTAEQTKARVVALCLVFAVVIFFWMAFHQNGLTLTWFARDYTANIATGFTRFGFSVWNLALLAVAVYAAFGLFQSEQAKGKILSASTLVVALIGMFMIYSGMQPEVKILPQIFQQFNPFFVVALTPVAMAFFGALAKRGKEPSAPRKIGLGMMIAALGFLVMAIGSFGLQTPEQLEASGGVSSTLVSPNWLIGTYLVLTFAELCLSPMGISFVSKVAPPKLKGFMMGGWFAATAIGNYLVAVIGYLWGGLPLWVLWTILIALCLISAVFIFSVMKKLENATK